MKGDIKISFLVIAGFLLLLSLIPYQYIGEGYDYQFHYDKARGESKSNGEQLSLYPPLFHWITSIFTFREETFKESALILLALIGVALFLLTRDWFSTFLYLTSTSFFWFFEQGIYAQALMLLLFVLIIGIKNIYARILLLLLSILTHSRGFELGLLTLLICYMYESGVIDYWVNKFWKIKNKILLGCSGWFPIKEGIETRPSELLDTHLLSSQSNNFSMALRVSFILKLFIEIFPIPFFYWALKQTIKNKHWHYLLLTIASLISGSLLDYRMFFIIPLVLIPGLTSFYRTLTGWKKYGFIALCIGNFMLNAIVWWNYKSICFCLQGLTC